LVLPARPVSGRLTGRGRRISGSADEAAGRDFPGLVIPAVRGPRTLRASSRDPWQET